MTWYDMHRSVHDYIRCQEQGRPEAFDLDAYDLSEAERSAFEHRDVGAFYELGLHGVLLNRYCRQLGYSLNEYRSLLEPYGTPEGRKGRWQSSS